MNNWNLINFLLLIQHETTGWPTKPISLFLRVWSGEEEIGSEHVFPLPLPGLIIHGDREKG